MAALILAGCVSALPTAVRRPGAGASPVASGSPGALDVDAPSPVASPHAVGSSLTGDAGPSLIGNDGTSLVANNSGSLVGKVKAPAGLLGDAGAGLISDKGGGLIGDVGTGLISNNGSGLIGKTKLRVLAAAEQLPVAGAVVTLVDAAGKPVLGADGQPMATRTDATGAYAFQEALPARNLFVIVGLGTKGQLAAIAPPAATERRADIDLVSSLTSAYILDQYVSWQPDPLSVLEKLPADVEAATRLKAETALSDVAAPVPAKLDRAAALNTVQRLRAVDVAFDAQMEVVKRLLVAAGQLNLGDGRPAKEVRLGVVTQLAFGPDGRLCFTTPWDMRIWRLLPDGTLSTVAGSATPDHGDITGKAGPEAGLDFVTGFTFDRVGRMLIAEDGSFERVSRLEADGRMRELWKPASTTLLGMMPGSGDTVLVLARDAGGTVLRSLTPGQAPSPLYTLPPADAAKLANTAPSGFGYEGVAMLIASSFDGVPSAWRFDTVTHAMTPAVPALAVGVTPMLDPLGRIFAQRDADAAGATRRVIQLPAGQVVATGLPRDLAIYGYGGVTLGPDGTAWIAGVKDGSWNVYHALADGLSLMAGATGATQSQAGNLSLGNPGGLAALPGGDWVVADTQACKLLRVTPAGQVSDFAGNGQFATAGDGGPALQASINQPYALGTDQAGNVYVQEANFGTGAVIRRIAPGGTITTAFHGAQDVFYREFAVAPDGTLYLTTGADLLRVAPGSQTPERVLTHPADDQQPQLQSIAVDRAGVLYGVANSTLYRWTEAGGEVVLKKDAQFHYVWNGGLALDALGRCYVSQSTQNTIVRYDPTNQHIEPIAGPGSTRLVGAGADDSLKQPQYLTFDASGNLLISDLGHKQVKRLPAADLP